MSHHQHIADTRSQKTLSSYVTGFCLSLLLTIAAFLIIEMRLFSDTGLYVVLAVLAIAQLYVQSVCFLRLNLGREGRWNTFPYLFTILITCILIGGTLWIMYNLNFNMV